MSSSNFFFRLMGYDIGCIGLVKLYCVVSKAEKFCSTKSDVTKMYEIVFFLIFFRLFFSFFSTTFKFGRKLLVQFHKKV